MGIHSVIRKKKKKYKPSSPETTAGNTLKRDFNAARPNEKWTTDVTEFKIPETGKKLYLSVILDLYDRIPVAYVVSHRNDNKLVFDTYARRLPPIRRQDHCSIRTGASSIQAKHFRKNFKNRGWSNPCRE